jgi:hypothetical protein
VITMEELAERLRIAYEGWLDISNDKEASWLAAAEVAYDNVQAENAEYQQNLVDREESIREFLVEFVNRAEALIE